MIVSILYGLIALATIAITVAARTRCLWKLGALFVVQWGFTTFINYNVFYPSKGIYFVAISAAAVYGSGKVYVQYNCSTAKVLAILFLLQTPSFIFYLASGMYTPAIMTINALFIVQALFLITVSLNHVISKNSKNKKTYNSADKQNNYSRLKQTSLL